jgi:hypothetical protein
LQALVQTGQPPLGLNSSKPLLTGAVYMTLWVQEASARLSGAQGLQHFVTLQSHSRGVTSLRLWTRLCSREGVVSQMGRRAAAAATNSREQGSYQKQLGRSTKG